MKQIFYTILFVFLLTLSACQASKPLPPTTYSYTGTISSNENGSIVITTDEHTYTIQSKDSAKYTKNSTVELITDSQNNVLSVQIIHTYTPEDYVNDTIEKLSLEEKVGQLFLVRLDQEMPATQISKYHVGGIILFAKDFQNETKNSISSQLGAYQAISTLPLLVAVDEEGGSVNRVSLYPAFRGVPFWSSQDLYQAGQWDLIISDTIEKATLLKSLGINVNMAPVADVSTNEEDYIYERSFGQDAYLTSEYIAKVVKTMKEQQIGSVLKHFPGYGNNTDTHTGIAIDNRPLSTFQASDFLPFQSGISAGADAILISHTIVTSIDDIPASLSPKVHQILRDDLHFDGVIISDDLSMQAIQKYTDSESAAIQSFLAGTDLLCVSDYKTQIPALVKAVEEGSIPLSKIEQSLKRILKWKYDLGLLTP